MVDSESSGLGGIAGIGIVAMVMFLIFALLMGRGGIFGGNGGGADAALALAMANSNRYQPQYATQDFVQQSNNFSSLVDQNRDITAAISNGTAQTVAAVNQAKYDNINVAKDIESLLLSQIGELYIGLDGSVTGCNVIIDRHLCNYDGCNDSKTNEHRDKCLQVTNTRILAQLISSISLVLTFEHEVDPAIVYKIYFCHSLFYILGLII